MTPTTLLVANRGEIARRVVRAARAMGLRTVSVYVDADEHSPYVGDADVAIRLSTSYLDVEALLDAAARANAQAVHPGYGFLSENADFASAVIEAGLIWVGPTPSVIAAMGDKLQAKELARRARVATLASSDNPHDASAVGFPLMVKAAAGGGGKGMRIVSRAEDLDEAVASAQREALGGFGDDRVFIERYVARARHVEIQVLADQFGSLVHLGERECSIQRRHQKLVEESPSPALDDALRDAMCAAALSLASAMNYQSLGTVEFLLDDATHEFYFLEVNTRLQVEHCVTEEVTGFDLVREQLRIAFGEPLSFAQSDLHVRGHAIEVRLCAEDPAAGFLPATGTLHAFEPCAQPAVRWESGVVTGNVVGVEFDPLLAKVIAHAPTRREAAGVLALALERLHVAGVRTNRDVLAATLRSSAFLDGDTTTDFLTRTTPALELELRDDELRWAANAAALWLQAYHQANAGVLTSVPSGWSNARLPRQRTTLRYNDRQLDVHYRARRDGSFDLVGDARARVHAWREDEIDVEIDQRRARTRVTYAHDHLYVQVERGTVDFYLEPRFSPARVDDTTGGLNAPMPGVVLEVRVTTGERVRAGATLAIIEAMKMEHVVVAPYDGTVGEVHVGAHEQVARGQALLTLEPDDAASVDSTFPNATRGES